MGLAASQARLLTITSRKSRAQFDEMKISHEKLALSRQLTDISNEYQNSLSATKLYYDYYGINSTDTPLTYNMLMSPSSLNDYTPTLISNNQNQIVLSSKYAAAARAAGIPTEGLGCTPSSIMRDAFMMALAEQDIITVATANSICAIDYNPMAGLGSDNLINTVTTVGDYKQLIKNLSDTSYSMANTALAGNGAVALIRITESGDRLSLTDDGNYKLDATSEATGSGNSLNDITLGDLLSGKEHYYLGQQSDVSDMYTVLGDILDMLGETLSGTLDGADDAVAYANSQMDTYFWKNGSYDSFTGYSGGDGDIGAYQRHKVGTALGAFGSTVAEVFTLGIYSIFGGDVSDSEVAKDSFGISEAYLTVADSYGKSGWFHDDPHDQATLDLSAFTQAWFTYFMQYMLGLGSATSNQLSVKWNDVKSASTFANADNLAGYEFTFTTSYVSDNEALIANFYDTLFNQICINGWTENNNVATDSSYLKEMLQSGMMYITSMSDDYYYYQGNYATNTFIKEVEDDAAIAQAESKYTTEKARINAKEQELDLKMKNLDTEISSLETEYEAVKKVIESNVSKSFTRYDS